MSRRSWSFLPTVRSRRATGPCSAREGARGAPSGGYRGQPVPPILPPRRTPCRPGHPLPDHRARSRPAHCARFRLMLDRTRPLFGHRAGRPRAPNGLHRTAGSSCERGEGRLGIAGSCGRRHRHSPKHDKTAGKCLMRCCNLLSQWCNTVHPSPPAHRTGVLFPRPFDRCLCIRTGRSLPRENLFGGWMRRRHERSD
jgi:hypothetical protein